MAGLIVRIRSCVLLFIVTRSPTNDATLNGGTST